MTASYSNSVDSLTQISLLTFLNGMPDPIVVKDRQHRWVAVNSATCCLLDKPEPQLVGQCDRDFLPVHQVKAIWQCVEEVFTTGVAQAIEMTLPWPQPHPQRCILHCFVIHTPAQTPYVATCIRAVDKPAQPATEAALRHSDATRRALIEAIPDLLIRMRGDGTQLNIALEGDFKQKAIAAPPDKLIYDCLPPEAAKLRRYYVNQALETDQLQVYDQELMIDGQVVYEEVRIIPSGEDEVLTMVRDVTARKQAEFELQRLNEQLENQVEARTAALKKVVSRLEREITDHKRAEIALQQSETQLRQQTQELQQTLQELQEAQMQLVQSEKMSSLGQLVAGVAHEINNPVNFIYGNLKHANDYIQDLLHLIRLFQQHYPDPVPEIQQEYELIDLDFLIEDLPKLLASMKVGADRIQKIVASLRTFSRMDEAEMKAVDLAECLDSTLMILQSRIKERPDRASINIHKQYTDLPLIECYAGQLNQVFMNILSNAIDALEDVMQTQAELNASEVTGGSPPTITIRLQQPRADRVQIAIADNGIGIPSEIQARIFDPFFTTKPIGKGTGMGLSISYQIVTEKHRGSLSCHSTPGSGTEFLIEIPIHQSSSQET